MSGPTIDVLAQEVADLRARVEAAEAVLAIQQLKSRYGELVDSRFARGALRDEATVREIAEQIALLFTEDGVWDGGPALGVAHGRTEIAERLRTSTLLFSRHLFVKPDIRVTGATATGRWDILCPCTTPDGQAQWMCGVEDDEYARTAEGTWLHRRMRLTTVFFAPATEGWSRIFT